MGPVDLNADRWAPVPGTAYEINERRLGGEWVSLRQGPSGRVVDAKFVVVRGITRLVGLRLDDGQPVTSRMLRLIRIAKLEDAFTRYVELQGTQHVELDQDLEAAYDRATEAADLEDLHGSSHVLAQMRREHEEWIGRLDVGDEVELLSRGRGAAPPSDAELKAFSVIYLRQRLHGRGAITRTADEVGVDRSTVYRWIERCQAKNFLPIDSEEPS